MKIKNLSGKKFGNLTVLGLSNNKTKRGQSRWIVRCKCGVEKEVTGVDLSSGNTRSCGCGKGFKKRDLTNLRFGRLVAVKPIEGRRKRGGVVWLCGCDCGKSVEVGSYSLVSGNTRSCGCVRWLVKDLLGKRFGRLVVKSLVNGAEVNGGVVWLCVCDCGNQRAVPSTYLVRGHTKCCGCEKGALIAKTKTQHGMTGTPTYNSWQAMKQRCLLDNYYIRKGITFDPRWKRFSYFLKDMGEAPGGFSLDRIDPKGKYEKQNCRWASRAQQANNKSNSKRIKFLKKNQTASQWARELNIGVATLLKRLRNGWSVEKALTTQVRPSSAAKKVKNLRHGMSKTRVYRIWQGMRSRCRRNARYLEKQITYDPRWDDFNKFLSEMGDAPKDASLDRIDVCRGYELGNCRWVNAKAQANNRSSNVKIRHKGECKTVAQWESELGLRRGIISSRLRAGWSIDRALSVVPKNADTIQKKGFKSEVAEFSPSPIP